MMIRLARETGCHVHLVHLADAGCLSMIANARAEGLKLTVETCPHYLYFAAESITDGQTQYKCAPPIRDAENRELLWGGLRDGLIDMIVSDHSPCPIDLKLLECGRFDFAWGGVSSLQLGLPVIWTAAKKRGFSIGDVVRWMSIAPASLVGLPQGIVPGNAAHLVVFDPDHEWQVDQERLLHKNRLTPYHDCRLQGVVRETFIHGQNQDTPCGKLL
jgi:allantoinase